MGAAMLPLDVLKFSVPGPAVGKERARTVRTAAGKSRTYTPGKTATYESRVRWLALSEVSRVRWTWNKGDVFTLHVQVWRPSLVVGPDADNILKAVGDALNRVTYPDDRRIVEVSGTMSEGPHRVEVTVARYSREAWT